MHIYFALVDLDRALQLQIGSHVILDPEAVRLSEYVKVGVGGARHKLFRLFLDHFTGVLCSGIKVPQSEDCVEFLNVDAVHDCTFDDARGGEAVRALPEVAVLRIRPVHQHHGVHEAGRTHSAAVN